MNQPSSKATYIHVRLDEETGKWYLQGREYKMHLAGKEDAAQGWDKFLFTAAKNVLGTDGGQKFKDDFNAIMAYMGTINKVGETTKVFCPLLALFGPDSTAPRKSR